MRKLKFNKKHIVSLSRDEMLSKIGGDENQPTYQPNGGGAGCTDTCEMFCSVVGCGLSWPDCGDSGDCPTTAPNYCPASGNNYCDFNSRVLECWSQDECTMTQCTDGCTQTVNDMGCTAYTNGTCGC